MKDKTYQSTGQYLDLELPNQNVSDSERRKPEWFIPTANYYIKLARSTATPRVDISECINNARGIVTARELDKSLNHLKNTKLIKDNNLFGSRTDFNEKELKTYTTDISDVDIITPITERYIGEFIKQLHDYRIYNTNAQANSDRNDKIEEVIQTALSNIVTRVINDTMQSGADPNTFTDDSINKLIKAEVDNFITDWESETSTEYENIFQLLLELTNAELLYVRAFFYWFATEEVVTYRCPINGEVYKELVHPAEYYRIPSGNLFIEDDHAGVRIFKKPLEWVVQNLGHMFNAKTKAYLINNKLQYKDENYSADAYQIFDLADWNYRKSLINDTESNILNIRCNNRELTITHVVFTSYQPVKRLKYYDINGEIKESIVPSNYDVGEYIGDIEASTDYIPRIYHIYRIGDDEVNSLYTECELHPLVREEINTYGKKLPYNGITGLFNDSYRNPVPKRLAPFSALYKIFTVQLHKNVAKYKDLTVVPESLLQDSIEMSKTERLTTGITDNLLIINDAEANVNSLQALNARLKSGSADVIRIISEVRENIKREAWEYSNYNSQRFGDISPSQGKGVTEYAIDRAATGTIMMYYLFDQFRQVDYSADIDCAKLAWINGKTITTYNKNDDSPKYINIKPYESLGYNIGVFVRNATIDADKVRDLKSIAFAAAQNGDTQLAAEAILADTTSKLKGLITQYAETAKKQKELEAQYAEQAKVEIEKLINERESNKLLNDRLNIELKESAETERTIMKLEVELLNIETALATTGNLNDNYKRELDLRKEDINRLRLSMEEKYKSVNAINSMKKDLSNKNK